MAPSAVRTRDSTCLSATCWESRPYSTGVGELPILGTSSRTAVIPMPTGMSHRRHPGGGGGAGAAGRSLGGPDRALVVIGVLRQRVARTLLAPSDTRCPPAGVRR